MSAEWHRRDVRTLLRKTKMWRSWEHGARRYNASWVYPVWLFAMVHHTVFSAKYGQLPFHPACTLGQLNLCKASTPDFKATERMENKDWVPVLEKCTVQWSRAVGKARKENKVFHPGNSDISLDFFCFVLFCCRQGSLHSPGYPKVRRLTAYSQISAWLLG